MRGVVVAILSGLLASGCSVFGIRTEPTPPYTVERTLGPAGTQVEIRRYGARLAAETVVDGTEATARNNGFRTLAGFIFGGNASKSSIDMTAPVAQARAADGPWRIRFFMPAPYTRETLPRPDNAAIDIVTVPAETIAVLRYAGSIGPATVHDREQELMRIATATGLHTVGEPFTWFYDPPWTLPPLRRNEAAVVIQPG